MLQNLDYMILLDADISFCMVCKLWYISIRCIFKNLALKLRIYNFRGVLCMQLSASPAITLPPILSLLSFYYPIFSTIHVPSRVFAIVFAVYFFTSISWLLIAFYTYSLPLYTILSLYGIIYLLFLKMALWCCNAPCTTHFWELYQYQIIPIFSL